VARQFRSEQQGKIAEQNHALGESDRAFISEYLKSFNLSAAARAAGSKAKNASQAGAELLRNPEIQAEIRRMVTKAAKSAQIDANWVLQRAKEMFEKCAGEIRPVLDRHGTPLKDPQSGLPIYLTRDGREHV
jgi:phage terminase small subunit